MIEPELQHYLSGINQHLEEIKKNQKQGIWRAFFHGIFSAFGYILGLFVFIFVLGFVLSRLGVVPAWKEQIKIFQSLIDRAQSVLEAGESMQGNTQGTGNVTEFTLPDGRIVKVMEKQ